LATQNVKDKTTSPYILAFWAKLTSGVPFMKTITGADEIRACNLSQKVIIIIVSFTK